MKITGLIHINEADNREIIDKYLKDCIVLVKDCLNDSKVKSKMTLIEFCDSRINRLRLFNTPTQK